MRFSLGCASIWENKDILDKYPILHNYNPIIDYPYPNPEASRLTIEVTDLIKFYDDIKQEIIIGKDVCDKNIYSLVIYDDYIE